MLRNRERNRLVKKHKRRVLVEMFWGCGNTYHQQRRLLSKLVEESVSIASGLQQPPHSESDEQARRDVLYRADAHEKLRARVADLAAAFGFELKREVRPRPGHEKCVRCGRG